MLIPVPPRLSTGIVVAKAKGVERDMNTHESLRYVSVRDVETDLGTDDVTVETPHGHELGLLDGFLVDSGLHSLRYFVVRQLGATSQTLARVPYVPARIDVEHGVLHLLDDAHAQALG